jgi:hypothetical protein
VVLFPRMLPIIYTNTGNFDLRQTTNEPRVRFGKETNSE